MVLAMIRFDRQTPTLTARGEQTVAPLAVRHCACVSGYLRLMSRCGLPIWGRDGRESRGAAASETTKSWTVSNEARKTEILQEKRNMNQPLKLLKKKTHCW